MKFVNKNELQKKKQTVQKKKKKKYFQYKKKVTNFFNTFFVSRFLEIFIKFVQFVIFCLQNFLSFCNYT